jgi:hypothetical protein
MRGRGAVVAMVVCVVCVAVAAATRAHAAEPPPMRVRIAPAPLALNGASAQITLDDAPADGAAPRFVTSVGAVDATGHFAVPDRRAPAWAIVAAEQGDARAASVLTLLGAGALPTQTKAGARVTVEIAGRTFGPVTADAHGAAAVPVEVPPDARVARVNAVDQSGFETTREVTLPSADFPLALVLAPTAVTADDDLVVTVFAITRGGAWRPATGAPPVLELPPGLVATGPARVPTPGRWDFPVRVRLDAASATAQPIGASVDGAAAVGARLDVRALPAAELKRRAARPLPTPPAPAPRPELALRAGGARGGEASGGDSLTSWTVAGDFAWPLGQRLRPGLHVVAGAAFASGSAGSRVRLRQLDAALGLRLRVPLGARVHADASTGVGWAFADATVDPGKNGTPAPSHRVSDDAPLLYVGAGLGVRLGPGDALVDLRWNDVRLAGATGMNGVAFGLAVTLGYQLRL